MKQIIKLAITDKIGLHVQKGMVASALRVATEVWLNEGELPEDDEAETEGIEISQGRNHLRYQMSKGPQI